MAQNYSQRAQQVQDEIGWFNMNNAEEAAMAMLHLAQLVRDLAVEVDGINAKLTEAAGIIHEMVEDMDAQMAPEENPG